MDIRSINFVVVDDNPVNLFLAVNYLGKSVVGSAPALFDRNSVSFENLLEAAET